MENDFYTPLCQLGGKLVLTVSFYKPVVLHLQHYCLVVFEILDLSDLSNSMGFDFNALSLDSSKCYISDTSKDKGGDGDDLGGSSDMGPSAALTPAIWDKTIPYDGENFHLEYMDLEEFLMENGIPSLPGEDARKVGPGGNDSEAEEAKSPQVTLLPSEDLDVCQKEVVTTASGDSDIICEVTTGESGEHKDLAWPHLHVRQA